MTTLPKVDGAALFLASIRGDTNLAKLSLEVRPMLFFLIPLSEIFGAH